MGGRTVLDLSFLAVLARAFAAILGVSGLGASMAFAAHLAGDAGPSNDGRATFNPLRQFDIFAFLSGVALSIGWALPMDIRRSTNSGDHVGLAVAGAGAIWLLALGLTALLLLPQVTPLLPEAGRGFYVGFAAALRDFAFASLLVNLLPLPPLLAGYCLATLQPRLFSAFWRRKRVISVTFATIALLISLCVSPHAITGLLP